MSPQQPFTIIYAPIMRDHLRFIDRKHYSLIQQTIKERLSYEPIEENRNRKPLKRTVFEGATWEIRFGPENTFRVYYGVRPQQREVHVLAIGIKLRDKVYIGGEEIDL